MEEGRFGLHIRKKFTVRVMRHWNRLPSEAIDAPLPGSTQGQARWGFEQPGLVGGCSCLSQRIGTRSS